MSCVYEWVVSVGCGKGVTAVLTIIFVLYSGLIEPGFNCTEGWLSPASTVQWVDWARLQLYSGLIEPGFNCTVGRLSPAWTVQWVDWARLELYSGLIEPGFNCTVGWLSPASTVQIKVDNSKREVHNMAAEVCQKHGEGNWSRKGYIWLPVGEDRWSGSAHSIVQCVYVGLIYTCYIGLAGHACICVGAYLYCYTRVSG